MCSIRGAILRSSEAGASGAVGTVVTALIVGFLMVIRRAFPARLAPGAWQHALAVLIGGLAVG